MLQANDKGPVLYLNGYVVARLVFSLIKSYLISNKPADVGVRLAQTYDPDPLKSQIKLDMSYNWKSENAGKVPAIYVQRGDVTLKYPTIGLSSKVDEKTGGESRLAFSVMPITISCIAAEPLAVVEQLAELVKQPLLYFRKEIEIDFHIRRLALEKISAPRQAHEGKNNFIVDLLVEATFDDSALVTKESMKIRRIGINLFDQLWEPLDSIIV